MQISLLWYSTHSNYLALLHGIALLNFSGICTKIVPIIFLIETSLPFFETSFLNHGELG